jgi:hypothetical protein
MYPSTLPLREWERSIDAASGTPTADAVAAAPVETAVSPHDDTDARDAVESAPEGGLLADVDTDDPLRGPRRRR